MTKFLYKSIIATIVLILLHLVIVFFANGYTDSIYGKISSGKQKSLLLGGSRMSQAILPDVIDDVMGKQSPKLYNFAFTNSHSGIGPVYFNAIKRKIDSQTKNGVYLISVSPWGVSSYGNDNGDEAVLRENNFELAKITDFSSSPNYDYMLNAYGYGWGSILLKTIEPKILNDAIDLGLNLKGSWTYIHKDGSLEIKSTTTDTVEINKMIKNEADRFIKEAIEKDYQLSSLRLEYLDKLISFLQEHGKVYLIRLPVNPKIYEFEEKMYPNFNQLMADVSEVKYINFATDGEIYEFCDGNHLSRNAAKLFSVEIAKMLTQEESENN